MYVYMICMDAFLPLVLKVKVNILPKTTLRFPQFLFFRESFSLHNNCAKQIVEFYFHYIVYCLEIGGQLQACDIFMNIYKKKL